MPQKIDLAGHRYGKLTVLRETEPHITPQGKPVRKWWCRCECGKELVVAGNSLRTGHTTSCGCHRTPSLVGRRYGKLTVLREGEPYINTRQQPVKRWLCLCDCGQERLVVTGNLNSGNTTSCGCETARQDLTGQRFGRLVVLAEADYYRLPSGGAQWRWLCRCDCGKETKVFGGALRSGDTSSCGCYGREQHRKAVTTHGRTKTPEYKVWDGMRHRCKHKSHPQWHNYGGRGIKVCDRWLHSFEAFLEDMGERPSPDHSIDRIDNDGDYEPGNCRWSTRTEQGRNRRTNRPVVYRGAQTTLVELAERFMLQPETLAQRIDRGVPEERWDCLPLPPGNLYEFAPNRYAKPSTLAKRLGMPLGTLKGRVRKGWPPALWGAPRGSSRRDAEAWAARQAQHAA